LSDQPEHLPIGTIPPSVETLRLLEELIPGVVIDGVIDAQRISEAVDIPITGNNNGKDRFGLLWADKSYALNVLKSPSLKTLIPDSSNSIDWDQAENIFIEGDNLEVLKLLQKSHNDSVKVIYIDPPYNIDTGLVYNDSFTDTVPSYLAKTNQVDLDGNLISAKSETRGRKHSNWLTMMYPRLFMARNLLTTDGVIFISIDDAEFAHLRMIMDEIFGPENFCGVIKRRAARKTAFLSKRMSDMCDYILIYVRSEAAAPLTAGQISDGTRPVLNAGNAISSRFLRKGAQAKCADGKYPAGEYGVRTTKFTLLGDLVVSGGICKNEVEILGEWRINQTILDKSLFITKNFGLRRIMLAEELNEAKLMNDLLDESDCYNEAGSESLKEIFGKAVFENPKPVGLIKRLCSAASLGDGDIILDFFAGSGTTAQAVAELNELDNFQRKFILVNLPEETSKPSIAHDAGFKLVSDITKARISKVMDLYPKFKSQGLKSLKIGESNFFNSAENEFTDSPQLIAKTLKDSSNENAVIMEILLRAGIDITMKWERILVSNCLTTLCSKTLVVLQNPITKDLLEDLYLLDKYTNIIFLEDAFAGLDALKANAYFNFKQINKIMRTV
jgi:adenine-specific DNA-methyltransferase